MTEPLIVTLPGAALRDALLAIGPLPERVELVEWKLDGPPPTEPGRQLDLVVPPYMGGSDRLGALAGVPVRLVQSQSIGYDDVPAALPPGHVYANAASVHETSTAELALALLLAAQRGIPDFVRAAGEGRWAPARHASLADRRVVLLGYGGVGRAIEARLAPFEVDLVRVATQGRIRYATDVTDPEPLPPGHPLFDLPNVLVSPHVGGASTAMMPRMARLLRDQIERMSRGELPRNIVLRS